MGTRTVRRSWVVMVLVCIAAPAPVLADGDARTDAKLQCQIAYGTRSELATACQRGVELAARPPVDVELATRDCGRDITDAGRVTACHRGIALFTRLHEARGEGEQAEFTYTWKRGRAAAQIDVGDYRLLLGDAEKSIEDCLRAYEGSSTPPSCLSGITAQRKPPGEPARR